LRAWERRRKAFEDDAVKDRLTKLMDFLKTEVENEVRISLAKKGFTDKKEAALRPSRPQKEMSTPTASDLVSSSEYNKKSNYIFCAKGTHQSSECFEARDLTLAQKNSIIKEKRACYYCLQKGHGAKHCRFKPKCHLCERSHFVLMCLLNPKNQSTGANTNNSSSDGTGSSQIVTSGHNYNLSNSSCSQVLLQTLQVRKVGPKDSARVRLLIDTGSDHSYVSKKAAEILGLKSLGVEKLRHGLLGGQVTAEKPH